MRRELAEWAQQVHDLSQRRVARLIPIDRATIRYEPHRDPHDALRVRLRELAGSRVRYGYRRVTVLLKREGWEVNDQAHLASLYRRRTHCKDTEASRARSAASCCSGRGLAA